jgi:hypothetical protein
MDEYIPFALLDLLIGRQFHTASGTREMTYYSPAFAAIVLVLQPWSLAVFEKRMILGQA